MCRWCECLRNVKEAVVVMGSPDMWRLVLRVWGGQLCLKSVMTSCVLDVSSRRFLSWHRVSTRPIWFPLIDFFIVGYEFNYGCVSSVLQDDNWAVVGCEVVCIEGEEEGKENNMMYSLKQTCICAGSRSTFYIRLKIEIFSLRSTQEILCFH